MSEQLVSKLAAVRHKHEVVSVGAGVSTAAAVFMGAVGVEMLVDWLSDLPWAKDAGLPWMLRLLVLLAILAGVGLILFRQVILPILTAPDDETLALAVERFEPAFAGRLISAIQLSLPQAVAAGTSAGLVRQLVRETEEMSHQRDFTKVISGDGVVKSGAAALLLLILGAVVVNVTQPSSITLLRRAFLSTDPVPRKTRIDQISGNIKVAKGEAIAITASAAGIKPSTGTLNVQYPKVQYTYALNPNPDVPGQYIRKIENITESFAYTVWLNDARSQRFTVSAVDRPAPLSIQCVEVLPAFTHQADKPHLPGDLSLMLGSRLIVTIKANKLLKPNDPVERLAINRVHLTGVEKDYPLYVDEHDNTLAGTPNPANLREKRGIPIPLGTTGLAIYLVDQDDLESKNPTVYRVDLTPKPPPTVGISSEMVHDDIAVAAQKQLIKYYADDEYGVGAVTLHYKVDNGAMHDVTVPIKTGLHVEGDYIFSLATVSPAAGKSSLEGSVVEFWLTATDTNPDVPAWSETQPHEALRVVSEAEFRRLRMAEFSGEMGKLDPVKEGEQQNTDALGNFVVSHGATTQP